MLRQLHIAQSLFAESSDLGVFREEMGDGFEQGTTPIPCISTFWFLKKSRYAKIALVGLY